MLLAFFHYLQMEVAIVAFTVTYDHNTQNLMVYIEKMAMRQRAVATYPPHILKRLRLHARLLPLRYRAQTRSQCLTGVYFVYNQVLTFSPARAMDIGSMWLRLRIYSRSKFRASRRVAEGHMLLTNLPLTHKTTPFTLTLMDEPDLTAFFSASKFKQRGFKEVYPTESEEQRELNPCLSQTRLAMQLNYDKTHHRFIVHLQRGHHLDRYGPFIAFEVLLSRPNQATSGSKPTAKDEIIHRLTSEVFKTETITLIHVAFELPASPALCRICKIVVCVYSGKERRLLLSKARPGCSLFEGSVTLGANVDGDIERQQYFSAFVDANPTDLTWFEIQESPRCRKFEVNSAFSMADKST